MHRWVQLVTSVVTASEVTWVFQCPCSYHVLVMWNITQALLWPVFESFHVTRTSICECTTDDGILCRCDTQCLWEAALCFHLGGWWWHTLQELVGKLSLTVTSSILGKSASVSRCDTGQVPYCFTWMRESVKRNITDYTLNSYAAEISKTT